MNETEDSGSSPNLWQAFRRRRKAMLWTGVAVMALAIVAALVWPARYSASGVILIEQQELPAELVRSTVSSYASQRVQVISQRVMTTDNLMGIIQRYGLYADMRKRSPREEVIKQMRADTALQMISADVIDPRDGHPTKATIAFSISYRSPSAELAAKVANELVSLYLQQNVETRERSSRDAAVFLTGESARLDKEIKEQQAKIAAFKEKHANELPELTTLNLQKTTRMEEEIRDADSQLRSLAQQLTFLDAQLAQISPTAQIYASTGERVQSPADRLKFVRTEYARALAIYSPDHPDVQRLKREMEGLEAATAGDATLTSATANDDRRQLESAQTQLESAMKRYSPDHPDVIRAQRLVDSLKARVSADDARGAPAAAPVLPGDPTLDRPANTGADNPPYIQIQAQRQATANEIRSLQQKRQELEDSLGGIERDLARTPAVERDYTAMLRDLESAQIQYRQVRQKQMEAETAQDLEVERKGERFTLIEPPYTPEEPTSPNRPLILLFGLMLAISSAFAAAALLESTDGSVRGLHDLRSLLTAPPLAVIPVMQTFVDRARARQLRRRALFGSVASVLLLLIVIHVLYRPLDVLWSVALRHLGI
ncbi:MAG: lipopolysaccharide biosynthesis protein [Proteobacteria bacterium]|nr:lipopolysaccharide biosynthesis protein [Pseudomonadota bacterium]